MHSVSIDDSKVTEEKLRDLLLAVSNSKCQIAKTDFNISFYDLPKESLALFVSSIIYLLKHEQYGKFGAYFLVDSLGLDAQWNDIVDNIKNEQEYEMSVQEFFSTIPYPSKRSISKKALDLIFMVVAVTNKLEGREISHLTFALEKAIREYDVIKLSSTDFYTQMSNAIKKRQKISIEKCRKLEKKVKVDEIMYADDILTSIQHIIMDLEEQSERSKKKGIFDIFKIPPQKVINNKKPDYIMEHPEQYSSEIKEVVVLTRDKVICAKFMNETYWTVSTSLLGYIDVKTNELVENETYIRWNLNNECENPRKQFKIREETCYRLLVRECLPHKNAMGNEIPKGRNLFVIKVLERECSEPRLGRILKEFQKAVDMTLSDGTVLSLNENYGFYEGTISWLQYDCTLNLYVDEYNSRSAEKAATIFEGIYKELEAWDNQVRRYAAKELFKLMEEWQADDLEEDEESEVDEITEEEFAGRIGLISLSIEPDGSYEFAFDDDELFYGHWIAVDGNMEHGFTDAHIEG